MFYKVTLGFTTGATYNMTNVHVFKAAQARRAYFLDLPRVPTPPGKPGKMRVHLENLEISWNFEKFNKYHGKMTRNLEKLGGY